MKKRTIFIIALLVYSVGSVFSQEYYDFFIKSRMNPNEQKRIALNDNIGIEYKINRPPISSSKITLIEKNSLVVVNQNVLFDEIKKIKYGNVSKKPLIAGAILVGIGLTVTSFSTLIYSSARAIDDPAAGLFVPPIIIFTGMALTGGGLIFKGSKGGSKSYDMVNEWEFEKR